MAAPITRSLVKARAQIERLQKSSKKARAKAGEITESLVTTGEVAGTSFAVGFWEGRITDKEEFEIFSIPIPLVVGVTTHMLALMGVGRGMEPHLRNIGNGALAAHLNGLGRKFGSESQTAKPTKSKKLPSPSDASKPVQGIGILEDDLISAARY